VEEQMPIARARGSEAPRRVYVSPAVIVGIVIALVLVWGFLLSMTHVFPESGRVRAAVCRGNLRYIAMACAIYSDDNSESYPDSLKRLYPSYIDNVRAFSCPAAPSTYQDFDTGKVTAASSSYTLVPGLRASMLGGTIIAYESAPNHDGRCVAFLNCDVKRLSELVFQKTIKAQQARLAAARAAE
jgi:hypothetical protein